MSLDENKQSQELIEHTLISKLVSEETYFIMYNLLAKSQNLTLNKIQENMNKLDNLLPDLLGVDDIIACDPEYKVCVSFYIFQKFHIKVLSKAFLIYPTILVT